MRSVEAGRWSVTVGTAVVLGLVVAGACAEAGCASAARSAWNMTAWQCSKDFAVCELGCSNGDFFSCEVVTVRKGEDATGSEPEAKQWLEKLDEMCAREVLPRACAAAARLRPLVEAAESDQVRMQAHAEEARVSAIEDRIRAVAAANDAQKAAAAAAADAQAACIKKAKAPARRRPGKDDMCGKLTGLRTAWAILDGMECSDAMAAAGCEEPAGLKAYCCPPR